MDGAKCAPYSEGGSAMHMRTLTARYTALFLIVFVVPVSMMSLRTLRSINTLHRNETELVFASMMDEATRRIGEIHNTVGKISLFLIFSDLVQGYMSGRLSDEMDVQAVATIGEFLVYDITNNPAVESIVIQRGGADLLSKGEIYRRGDGTLFPVTASGSSVGWTPAHPGRGQNGREAVVVNAGRTIPDRRNLYRNLGAVTVQIRNETVFETIDRNTYPRFTAVAIIDEAGTIRMYPDQSRIGNPITSIDPFGRSATIPPTGMVVRAGDVLLSRRALPFEGSYLIGAIDTSDLIFSAQPVRRLFGVTIGAVFLMGGGLGVLFYLGVASRIVRLSREIGEVSTRDLTGTIHRDGRDEITSLQESFVELMQRVRSHIETEWNLKLQQQEAEFRALQSRIDPHFLYNTLDMIRWNARLENALDTSVMIEKLSHIFRCSLQSETVWTSLKEEALYLQSYVDLLNPRFDNRVELAVRIAPDIEGLQILRQIIQPLVENAVRHGLNDQSHLLISVSARIRGAHLELDIIDDGRGLRAAGDHRGALENVRSRIALAFGPEYGIVPILRGKGTHFRLILPIVDGDGDETSGEKVTYGHTTPR